MDYESSNVKQLLVHVALYVDVDSIGEGGANQLQVALEAMAGVAAKGLMDTHGGVLSWVASRHTDSVSTPEPEEQIGVREGEG